MVLVMPYCRSEDASTWSERLSPALVEAGAASVLPISPVSYEYMLRLDRGWKDGAHALRLTVERPTAIPREL